MNAEPSDQATKDFLKKMKDNHVRDLKDRETKGKEEDAAYAEKMKKREEKDKKFNPDGNAWTADMPDKYLK